MTRAYASWVEPVAERTSAVRMEFVEVARSIPAGDWDKSSPVAGWTYKDLLAHLAGDTGKNFLSILRAVVARERVDGSLLGSPDDRNARDLEERRGRSVEELIAEIEADTEEHLDLVSRLSETDKDLRQDDIPTSLGEGLTNDPGGHVRRHLAQLRTALEAS